MGLHLRWSTENPRLKPGESTVNSWSLGLPSSGQRRGDLGRRGDKSVAGVYNMAKNISDNSREQAILEQVHMAAILLKRSEFG